MSWSKFTQHTSHLWLDRPQLMTRRATDCGSMKPEFWPLQWNHLQSHLRHFTLVQKEMFGPVINGWLQPQPAHINHLHESASDSLLRTGGIIPAFPVWRASAPLCLLKKSDGVCTPAILNSLCQLPQWKRRKYFSSLNIKPFFFFSFLFEQKSSCHCSGLSLTRTNEN